MYREGVKAYPENPELCTSLGLLLLQSGDHGAAFEHLGTAMAFDPNYSRAVMALGSVMQSHQVKRPTKCLYYSNKQTLQIFCLKELR